MSFTSLIRPDRLKLVVAFVIPIVYFLIILAVNPLFLAAFLNTDPLTQLAGIGASIMIGALIYYPLSCGAVFLFRRFSGEKPAAKPKKGETMNKKVVGSHERPTAKGRPAEARLLSRNRDLVYAIVLILVFNPFVYSTVSGYINMNVLNHPCGVEVVGYTLISPAEEANMTAGEIIISADRQRIDTTDSLTRFLAGTTPYQAVLIQTNLRSYSIKLAENPDTHKAILGIISRTAYCPAGQSLSAPAGESPVPDTAYQACLNSCVHTRDAGDTMENGPCLLDPIPVEPDWVCDIVHNPRTGVDNLPDNQCSFFGDGKAGHFIELDTQCNLIRAV